MTIEWEQGVQDDVRVAAVSASGLYGSGPEEPFDRLAELAAVLTGAERSCITMVDAQSFTFKSTVGVPEGTSDSGKIEESFCRYVVGTGRPMVVSDAQRDPRVSDNAAIQLYGVAAWAGYPIGNADGLVYGTFCLINSQPHEWTDQEILILATLAQSVSTEIALRDARNEIEKLHQSLG